MHPAYLVPGLGILALSPSAAAQLCAHDIDAPQTPVASSQDFGWSVSLSATTAAIGDPLDDLAAINAGALTFYSRNPTTERLDFDARLAASDAQIDDAFGTAVGIDGDVAIVGSPNEGTGGPGAGAAYIFRRSGGVWAEEQKLVASDAATTHRFGESVAIEGTRAIVGAPGISRVYVFEFNGTTWIERHRLAATAPAGQHLGRVHIELEGDQLSAQADGATAIFAYQPLLGVWVQETTVPTGYGREQHSLTADRIVTGFAGWVHTRDRDPVTGAWGPVSATNLLGGNEWVSAVAQLGQSIYVGLGASRGLIQFVRTGNSWTIVASITDSEYASTQFGWSVNAQGAWLLAGAPNDGAGGRVYLYNTTCPIVSDISCYQPVQNSSGASGRLHAVGSPSLAANNLTLIASLLPANSFGFFLTSRSAGVTVMPGGAVGNLCLNGNIGRYVGPGQIQNTGALGRFDLAIDVNAMPTPSGFTLAAVGERWYFQAWHRDANPTLVSNFTDSVSVYFQ